MSLSRISLQHILKKIKYQPAGTPCFIYGKVAIEIGTLFSLHSQTVYTEIEPIFQIRKFSAGLVYIFLCIPKSSRENQRGIEQHSSVCLDSGAMSHLALKPFVVPGLRRCPAGDLFLCKFLITTSPVRDLERKMKADFLITEIFLDVLYIAVSVLDRTNVALVCCSDRFSTFGRY